MCGWGEEDVVCPVIQTLLTMGMALQEMSSRYMLYILVYQQMTDNELACWMKEERGLPYIDISSQ